MNGKPYKLSILPLFEDDLDEIVDYITFRLRNPNAAERLVDDVEAAIRPDLLSDPESCIPQSDTDSFSPAPVRRRRTI